MDGTQPFRGEALGGPWGPKGGADEKFHLNPTGRVPVDTRAPLGPGAFLLFLSFLLFLIFVE